MRHLTALGVTVREWAEREPAVRALLWYGTFALERPGPHSDVDAAVIHTGAADTVLQSLCAHLGSRVRESVIVASRGEAAVWVDDALTKVDLRLAGDPSGFSAMAASADVPQPRFVVVLDKDQVCGALAQEAATVRTRDVAALVNEEIEKFLLAFEAASNAHRRSDAYRCYFEHNLALHRLARLVELARGDAAYLFLPRMLLSERMSIDEQVQFRTLSGELYLPEVADLKRRLAAQFVSIVQELSSKVPLRRPVESVRAFLDAVLARDLFFNVRDFADAFGGRVRTGVLFRGSALSRWHDHPELQSWLAARRVRCVVDFRDPEEAASKHVYPAVLAAQLNVRQLPLSKRPGTGRPTSATDRVESYFRCFVAFAPNVVTALRLLATPADSAVFVHCYVGKDRTGWFCALVALLLEMDEEQIVDDYVRSGQDTHDTVLRGFLDRVAKAGGARALLQHAGLETADIEALRLRLLTPTL